MIDFCAPSVEMLDAAEKAAEGEFDSFEEFHAAHRLAQKLGDEWRRGMYTWRRLAA
jgi:hypothetical protein